jgi:hypothetical protein
VAKPPLRSSPPTPKPPIAIPECAVRDTDVPPRIPGVASVPRNPGARPRQCTSRRVSPPRADTEIGEMPSTVRGNRRCVAEAAQRLESQFAATASVRQRPWPFPPRSRVRRPPRRQSPSHSRPMAANGHRPLLAPRSARIEYIFSSFSHPSCRALLLFAVHRRETGNSVGDSRWRLGSMRGRGVTFRSAIG